MISIIKLLEDNKIIDSKGNFCDILIFEDEDFLK